ncbi:hypothetical protein BRADI_2g42385v3, partial [Brachypodium distachyon]
ILALSVPGATSFPPTLPPRGDFSVVAFSAARWRCISEEVGCRRARQAATGRRCRVTGDFSAARAPPANRQGRGRGASSGRRAWCYGPREGDSWVESGHGGSSVSPLARDLLGMESSRSRFAGDGVSAAEAVTEREVQRRAASRGQQR